jgi:hypothetical protein
VDPGLGGEVKELLSGVVLYVCLLTAIPIYSSYLNGLGVWDTARECAKFLLALGGGFCLVLLCVMIGAGGSDEPGLDM